MPSKYRIILEMASQTARNIASNADRYTDFLITAANNYKYSFKEQLLIHAQKPDATACAEIDTWNKLGRWVNKGTKGIALLIDRDVPYKLRHVFDISDTNSRAGRNITLWRMKPEYEYAVSESLQASFGDVEEPRDFPHLLMDISGYAVEDNLSDYLMELNAVKAGSFLEELDDTSLEAWLKTSLKSSVAFMALSRAGYEPRQYFDREDFSHLFDFNTLEVISVLGAAVSDVSEMVIREMGETVKEMDYRQYAAWRETDEGKNREIVFGKFEACSEDDSIIFMECNEKVSKELKKDCHRKQYILSRDAETPFQVMSYSTMTFQESEIYGEDVLEDTECNVEESVMQRMDIERVRTALKMLTPEERAIIQDFFFTESPVPVKELVEKYGMPKSSIYRKRDDALKALKKILGNA